ncbi:hypothetical protein AAKU67_004028 [Oxalobacteraceae bacterium GrIS 2.11]
MISKSNFFTNCWSGNAKLWQAFWIGAIAGKILTILLCALIGFLIWKGPQDNILVDLVLIPFLLSYLVFASVSVWRCASNTDTGALGGLARVWVVFSIAIWALMVIRAY